MSPLATVISAWAAVYAYVCAYYVVLYTGRRERRVYLSFGLLAGGLAVYSAGAAMLASAETIAEAERAFSVEILGITPGVAFAVDFCHQLMGKQRSRATKLALVWAAVGLVLTLAGATVTGEPATQPFEWGFAAAPDYVLARPTLFGQLHLSMAWVFMGYSLIRLVPIARHDRETALMLGSLSINLLAGGHDLLIHATGLRSWFLLEHTAMLSIVAMSYMLLDRFVRTGEQLQHRTFELRRSYEELRHTQEELVRKEQLAAVGELSAVIAHEVRNPLAIIKNSVSGLRRPTLGEADRGTLLGIMDEEVDRLNRLVHDLLAYAKPMAPQGREMQVEDLIQRSLDTVRGSNAKASQVEFDVDLVGGPTTVHGDPDLLHHALLNIVDNAVEAMGEGGVLTIRARPVEVEEGRGVALDFTDTGEGMDTQVRSKARDPFFTTRPAGTGLGLAIVERVITSHGGRVEIDSRSGSGTTVSLVLPAERVSFVPSSAPTGTPPVLGGE